jgi:ApaG protein
MSNTVTEGIRISVVTRYMPEQSDKKRGVRVFAYDITITNEGERAAQLVSRKWIIRDGWGRTEEVEGPGVVGNTPHLKPGETFSYTSYCPIQTATGSMEGYFVMKRDAADGGSIFKAMIDPFYFAEPDAVN